MQRALHLLSLFTLPQGAHNHITRPRVSFLYARSAAAGTPMEKTSRPCDLRVVVEITEAGEPLGAQFVANHGSDQTLALTAIKPGGIADRLRSQGVALREGMLLARVGDADVSKEHHEAMLMVQEAMAGPRPLRMTFVPPPVPEP